MDSHSNATCSSSTQKHRKMACAERKRKLTNAVYTIQPAKESYKNIFLRVFPLAKKREREGEKCYMTVTSCYVASLLSSDWSPIFAQANFAEAEMQSMIWLSSCALVFVFVYASARSIIATWMQLKELHWLGPKAMHSSVQSPAKSQANWQY